MNNPKPTTVPLRHLSPETREECRQHASKLAEFSALRESLESPKGRNEIAKDFLNSDEKTLMFTESPAQHTPTPWTIQAGCTDMYIGPLTGDGSFKMINPVVCRINLDKLALYSHHGKHNGSRQRLSKDEAQTVQANAEYIVRCVNSHDQLLAALKEAQETLLHNRIDTGPLPGMSQRIRLAIANAEKR